MFADYAAFAIAGFFDPFRVMSVDLVVHFQMKLIWRG
jgi:hypothetical protein